MKNLKYSGIILIILITINHLSSQSIKKMTHDYYQYDDQAFRYKAMDSIFAQSEQANAYFLKAKKQFKTSKTMGIVSLTSLGVGATGLVVMGTSDGFWSDDPAWEIGAVMFGLGSIIGAIIGTCGLISRGSAKNNQRQSVSTFNRKQVKPLHKKKVDLNVVVKNGIGIQLKF